MTPIGEVFIATDFPNFDGEALCAEVDPELFYPEVGNSAHAAKTICRRCAVIDQCLEWALENGEQWGVLGGLSPEERAALRKRRPPVRRGNEVTERSHGNEAGVKQHVRRGEKVCDACRIGARNQRLDRDARRARRQAS
jgi:hypothetical protein